MATRIDHVAKALGHLSGWDTTGDFPGEVAAAQVHATLALVEQQRIANIIALTDTVVSPRTKEALLRHVREHLNVDGIVREVTGG